MDGLLAADAALTPESFDSQTHTFLSTLVSFLFFSVKIARASSYINKDLSGWMFDCHTKRGKEQTLFMFCTYFFTLYWKSALAVIHFYERTFRSLSTGGHSQQLILWHLPSAATATTTTKMERKKSFPQTNNVNKRRNYFSRVSASGNEKRVRAYARRK